MKIRFRKKAFRNFQNNLQSLGVQRNHKTEKVWLFDFDNSRQAAQDGWWHFTQTLPVVYSRFIESFFFLAFFRNCSSFGLQSPVYGCKPFHILANPRFCHLMRSDMKKEGETKSINYLSPFFLGRPGQSRKSKIWQRKSYCSIVENLVEQSRAKSAFCFSFIANNKKVMISTGRYDNLQQ